MCNAMLSTLAAVGDSIGGGVGSVGRILSLAAVGDSISGGVGSVGGGGRYH